MALATKTATPRATTDVEDIRLLADGIIALIRTPEFDDMTWPEVDAALQLTSHDIKITWQENNSVKPVEPPPEPEAARRR